MKRPCQISCGKIRGCIASEKLTGMLKCRYPHWSPGRSPIHYDDTTATYAISVESKVPFTNAQVAELLAYVRGAGDMLHYLDIGTYIPRSEQA